MNYEAVCSGRCMAPIAIVFGFANESFLFASRTSFRTLSRIDAIEP
ncbi:MAG: hypothetical protein ABIZ81_00125 [Opitutaceae bacterium]